MIRWEWWIRRGLFINPEHWSDVCPEIVHPFVRHNVLDTLFHVSAWYSDLTILCPGIPDIGERPAFLTWVVRIDA